MHTSTTRTHTAEAGRRVRCQALTSVGWLQRGSCRRSAVVGRPIRRTLHVACCMQLQPGSCRAALPADRYRVHARTVNRAWCGESGAQLRLLVRKASPPQHSAFLCVQAVCTAAAHESAGSPVQCRECGSVRMSTHKRKLATRNARSGGNAHRIGGDC